MITIITPTLNGENFYKKPMNQLKKINFLQNG